MDATLVVAQPAYDGAVVEQQAVDNTFVADLINLGYTIRSSNHE